MDYLVKAIIFMPFLGIVYLFIDYFKSILYNSINSFVNISILCQFGVLDGLSVFFTIIVSAFIGKQVLNFLK